MLTKIFFLLNITIATLYANANYILNDTGLLDPRAKEKINQIGTEVKQKLNVNIYIDLKGTNGIDMNLPRPKRIELTRQKDKEILKHVKGNYIVLVLALEQMYANILMPKEFENIIDKNDILDGYVIPLLASHDKNRIGAKASAAVLNGYAQIADSLAAKKNIKLKSSIGSQGKTASTIWRVFMYSIVVFGIVAYVIIVLRERKYKKKGQE